jgi:hypothetical protein
MPDEQSDTTAPAAETPAPTAAADVPEQAAVADQPIVDAPGAALPETPPPAPEAPKTLGQIAYEAYGAARDWKTVSGGGMPEWHDQRPDLQLAWEAGAAAAADAGTHELRHAASALAGEVGRLRAGRELRIMAADLHAALVEIAPQEASDHAAVARDLMARVREALDARVAFLEAAGPR